MLNQEDKWIKTCQQNWRGGDYRIGHGVNKEQYDITIAAKPHTETHGIEYRIIYKTTQCNAVLFEITDTVWNQSCLLAT
jgi:hypothetical protein